MNIVNRKLFQRKTTYQKIIKTRNVYLKIEKKASNNAY